MSLFIAVQGTTKQTRRVITTIDDDSAIETATELASNLIRHGKKHKKVYIYLKTDGRKPQLIKRVIRTWTGKVKEI